MCVWCQEGEAKNCLCLSGYYVLWPAPSVGHTSTGLASTTLEGKLLNIICSNSASLLPGDGGMCEHIKFLEDYDFWLRLMGLKWKRQLLNEPFFTTINILRVVAQISRHVILIGGSNYGETSQRRSAI